MNVSRISTPWIRTARRFTRWILSIGIFGFFCQGIAAKTLQLAVDPDLWSRSDGPAFTSRTAFNLVAGETAGNLLSVEYGYITGQKRLEVLDDIGGKPGNIVGSSVENAVVNLKKFIFDPPLRLKARRQYWIRGADGGGSVTMYPDVLQAKGFEMGWSLGNRSHRKDTPADVEGEGVAPRWRLTIDVPSPTILNQPLSVIAEAGASVTLTVEARDAISFQWVKDGTELPGATNATLTLTNVQPPRIGDYQVVVSNGAGSVTSSLAALNIQGVDAGIWKGLVAYYPFDGSVDDESGNGNNGKTGTYEFVNSFSTALGKAYRSSQQSSPVMIGHNSALAQIADTGKTFTIVFDFKPDPNSGSGNILTDYRPQEQPFQNLICANIRLTKIDQNKFRISLLRKGFYRDETTGVGSDWTKDTGLVGSEIDASAWWQIGLTIDSNRNGTNKLYLNGQFVAGFSAAEYGGGQALWEIARHDENGERPTVFMDQLRFWRRGLTDAEIAMVYRFDGVESTKLSIISQPKSVNAGIGELVNFNVSATNGANFQWTKDGYVLPGATNATLTFTNVQPVMIGDYRVVVSNGAGGVTSSVAALNIRGVDAGIWKSLVAFYQFEGTLEDSSGFGNHGVITNSVYMESRFEKSRVDWLGMAAFFNKEWLIGVPYSKMLSFSSLDAATFSFWIKPDNAVGGVVYKFGSGQSVGYKASIPYTTFSDGFITFNATDASQFPRTFKPILAGEWSHITMTWDGSYSVVYVNGVEGGRWLNISPFGSIVEADLVIGGIWGRLDQLRIFRRALTSGEVTALYAYDSAPPIPTVVSSPTNQTMIVGQTLSLSAQISGSSLVYRWQKDGVDLADGARISGASTPVLIVSEVMPSDSGQYRLAATNTNGSAVTAAATVTVEVPLAIVQQPSSVTIASGYMAMFSVAASGSMPLAYQWFKDGNTLPGATNATLTFTNVQPPRIGDYRVVVSNGAGSVTSSVATLNIQGVDSGIWKGLVAYYPLDGDGRDESGLANHGSLINTSVAQNRFGKPNSALSFNGRDSLVSAPNRPYHQLPGDFTISVWVQARDGGMPSIGSAALLGCDNGSGANPKWLIQYCPAPYLEDPAGGARDVFFSSQQYFLAETVGQRPGSRWVNYTITRKGTEYRQYIDGKDVFARNYYWTGSSLITDVPITGELILPGITAPLTIGWAEGMMFFNGIIDDVRIYNRALLNVEVAALYLSEAPPVVAITSQPQSVTANMGETVAISVGATNATSFQWSKDGTAMPGATNATLTFTNVQPPRIGDYRVVVSNGAGSVTSSVATLNIQGVDAGIWKGLVAYYPFNGNANDESGNKNDGVPSNLIDSVDRFGNNSSSYYFGGNSIISSKFNIGITGNSPRTVICWLKANTHPWPRGYFLGWNVQPVRPTEGMHILFPEFGSPSSVQNGKFMVDSNGPRVLGENPIIDGRWIQFAWVYTDRMLTSKFYVDGVQLINRSIETDHSSSLNTGDGRLMLGSSYTGSMDDVRIYNRALSDAEVAALYAYESAPPVPTVVTAPADQTVIAGQTLSLSAQIAGSNLAYRWQKDGADLADGGRVSGASTPTLTITGVTLADAGQYRLTAFNANGTAATAAATVAVRVPPAITQQPQSVDGIEGDAITLSVSVTGVPAPTFQWFKNGQAHDGQTAATLEFPALQESDAGTYRVVVSNPAGSVTSSDAVLTYTPAIRVLADGVAVREVVRTLLPVTVDLQFARNDWFLFYSLDDSEPTFASESFLVPFVVGQASVLRVVAYSPDFSQSVVSAPVTFRFLQPQSISWDAVPSLQYQQQGTVGVSASSGLPVVLSVVSGPATLSGNQLTATGVGEVVLRAVQAGNEAFASVTSDRTFAVTQAQQTLTWPTLASRIFGEAAFPVVVTASSGLPVTLAVTSGKATVSGTSVTLNGAGSVTLTATQAGDANRAEVSESKTFAVAKAEQTLTFPTVANRPYTPEPFAPAGTASSGLALAFEVLSGPAVVDSGKIRLTGVGSVVVRATQPGNADYNAALPVDRTFTVSQGTQTLTFTPVGAKTFGDAPVTLSATSSAGLVVTFRVLSGPGTVSGNLLTLSGAGTLVLQALQAGTDLYAAASASQNVVVAKAAQTLTFAALSDTGYTTSVVPLVASASSGLPVTFRVVSGPATVSGSELRLTGVGTVSVAADQAGTGNYLAATSVTRSFTVSRGTQEITFTPIGDQVLGSPAVTLSATSSSGLSVAFQVISGPATVIGNQLTLLNEGTVVVRARQAGSPLWLTAQVDQTFQIKKLTTLTLSAVTGGSITVDPVKERYDPKDVVTLQATASDGYQFVGWSGDLTGTANPTTLVMAANRTVGATFKDIAAPVLTWDLPEAGTTGNEQAVLSGRVTDNAPGVTATWRRDGGAAEALPLATDGSFRVEGLKLAPGANTFAVSAKDAAGAVTTLERIVTWVPERVLQVSTAAEVQEGQRMVFPVDLAVDAANVAGLTFRLGFDPSALTDPQVEWGALVGQSVNNVNILPGGEINATFSLAGSALPMGTNRIVTLSFRARSVPGATNTVLSPTIVSLGTPTGAALTTGNAVVSGAGRILPRKIKGDNNANQRIDVGDAVVISRLQVGLEELRPWDVAMNDLNATGSIDNGDVIKALRYVVGLDAQPKAAPRVGGELSVQSGVFRGEGAAVAGRAEEVGPGVGWSLSRPVPQSTVAPTDLRPVASGRGGLRPTEEGGGVSGVETRSSTSEAGLNPQLSALHSQPARSLRPAGSNTNDVATLEFPDGPMAQVGKPYRVVVKLTRAGAAIAGLSFTVNYPSALTLTDKQVGALVPSDALPLWAESAGSVNLAAVRSTVWPTSTGVAAVLTFLPTVGINAQASWPIELVKGEVTGAGFDIRALDNVTGEIRSTSTPPVEPKVVVPTLPTDGGPLALDVEAAAGAAIVLETTTDLSAWSEAQRLTGQGAGKPVRVTVTPDPNARARFWRVRVP